MLSNLCATKLFSLVLLICATVVATQDFNITIPLNKTTTFGDKQLYGEFITLNRTSKLQVNFSKGKDLAFIIFQVHSHLYNITLYKNVKKYNTSVSGTNVGLHSGSKEMETDRFFVENLNTDVDLKLYVAVLGYFVTDPIPGGCGDTDEFSESTSPYMKAIYNRDYIYVDIASAKYNDPECSQSTEEFIQLRFFMLYLPEQNHDSDVYFEGIKSMMTLNNILRNGRSIPRTGSNTRRMLSAYLGTGVVYVAVANPITNGSVDESKYSIYVPTTSYACAPAVDGDCEYMDDFLSRLLCASLFFIGIFICYFGHRFFKTHMFFIGFLSGLVVTYILVCLVKRDIDVAAALALSSLCGICVGAMRVVYWWIYGLPVLSIILSSADVGFLVSSVMFYAIPDEVSLAGYLNLEINFWTLFILVMILVTILLLAINVIANLICCAVIGAFATILPIDYYSGSQMKYILINIERRATVTDFYKAMQMPTFQWKDWLLAFLWLGLSVTGFIFQYHQNKGRPPFPPPPRSVRAVPELPALVTGSSGGRSSLINEVGGVRSLPHIPNERTPLLT